MLYESMEWNETAEDKEIVGSEEDLEKRREKMAEVRQWRANLPPNLRDDTNFTPQTCYLRYMMALLDS